MTETKIIRQALRSIGYNARKVSVRSPYYGSITFTIRDASVDRKAIEEFAKQYEEIDRCEASGEILSGGNTFVHVEATEEVQDAWAAPYAEKLEAVLENSADAEERVGTPVEGIEGAYFMFDGFRVHLVLFREGSSVGSERTPEFNFSRGMIDSGSVKSIARRCGVWLHENL